MKRYLFTLQFPPRTKKTSNQAVTIGGRTRVLPSKAYREYFKEAMNRALLVRTVLRDQGATLPIRTPVRITAVFYLDANRKTDMNGLQQALADALQETKASKKNPAKMIRTGMGVIEDDYLIRWSGDCDRRVDRDNPRTEVVIEVLG